MTKEGSMGQTPEIIEKFWALSKEEQIRIATAIFGKEGMEQFSWNWTQEHASPDEFDRDRKGWSEDMEGALDEIRANGRLNGREGEIQALMEK